jgi:hypothetical protein
MKRRFSDLPPVARMEAVAEQIAYPPASFPDDWAREFTDEYIPQLDAVTRRTLIERTRGRSSTDSFRLRRSDEIPSTSGHEPG